MLLLKSLTLSWVMVSIEKVWTNTPQSLPAVESGQACVKLFNLFKLAAMFPFP